MFYFWIIFHQMYISTRLLHYSFNHKEKNSVH